MTDNIHDNDTILHDNSAEEVNPANAVIPEKEEPAVKEPAGADDQPPAPARTHESRNFVWLAVISIVLTVAAWVAGSFNGIVAICICVAAIVAGAFSLKSRRHGVRNTAITSIIAAAVLLVVISAFLTVIYIGLKSI